jgi:outer membrane lipoprotein
MKQRIYTAVIGAFLTVITFSCAPVISKDVKNQVTPDLSFKEVLQNPEAHKGKVVLWGGVITRAKNREEGTLIEVLQKPTNREGRPKDVDHSDGRFLALYDGFLDVAIYSKGREVTVVGEVRGKRILTLGEIDYAYPLILVKKIHLWPTESKERLHPYPYPYWHYPWWWHHPYRRYPY